MHRRITRALLRAVATVGATVAMVGLGAVAASATTDHPEGGTWEYGIREYTSTPYLYSEYLHGSRTHKASTVKHDGTLSSSGWVQGGRWAKAPEQASNYNTTTNHWYYDVR